MPPRQSSGEDMPSLPEYAPLTVASTTQQIAQAFPALGRQRLGTNRCAAGTRSHNFDISMLFICLPEVRRGNCGVLRAAPAPIAKLSKPPSGSSYCRYFRANEPESMPASKYCGTVPSAAYRYSAANTIVSSVVEINETNSKDSTPIPITTPPTTAPAEPIR